jgi:aspartate/methionine/tyrosine aminotransferase
VGPAELVYRAYRLNNLLGVNQPYMTEDLACLVLSEPAAVDYIAAWAKTAAKGRVLFDHFLERTPQVSCVKPQAGICGLVELPEGMDDLEFSRRLLERKATTVFPGSLFECPGTVRVAFGGPRDDTAEGLKRVRDMILEWK